MDNIFILIDVFLTVILACTITGDFEKVHTQFFLVATLLYITIAIRYYIHFKRENNQYDLDMTKLILSGTAMFLLSLFNFGNYNIQIIIYFSANVVLAGAHFVGRFNTRNIGINFHHYSERLSLLVILFFGEAIIGLTKTIDTNHINNVI